MNRDPQKDVPTPTLSPLAQEKTYGEKKFDFVFGTVINFWVNLLTSAGFAFWVVHSRNPIKLPFSEKEIRPLNEYQEKLAGWINQRGIMRGIKDEGARYKRSEAMASLFTLLTPGHFILIPSVWLGDKIKPAFVKHFDRKHYGDEAMQNPDLVARHEALEMADRHTLIGTLVGRLGTVVATQTVARTLGNEENWANKLGEKTNIEGLKKFGGVDPLAGRVGDLIGDDMERIAPKMTTKVNEYFGTHNFTWSTAQTRNPKIDTSGPYNKAVQNFSRYVAQDVIYTLISSATIKPTIDFVKKFIPGMTYKPKPKPGMDLETIAQVKVPSAKNRDEVPTVAPTTGAETPDARVSDVTPHATLHSRAEQSVAHVGS